MGSSQDQWNKENYDSLSIRVPKGTREVFRQRCAERGVSMNNIVAEAIERFISDTSGMLPKKDFDEYLDSLFEDDTVLNAIIKYERYQDDSWKDNQWRVWPDLSAPIRQLRPTYAPIEGPIFDISPRVIDHTCILLPIASGEEALEHPLNILKRYRYMPKSYLLRAAVNGEHGLGNGWLQQIQSSDAKTIDAGGKPLSQEILAEAADHYSRHQAEKRYIHMDSVWLSAPALYLDFMHQGRNPYYYIPNGIGIDPGVYSGHPWCELFGLPESTVLLTPVKNFTLMVGNPATLIADYNTADKCFKDVLMLELDVAAYVELPDVCVLIENVQVPERPKNLAE